MALDIFFVTRFILSLPIVEVEVGQGHPGGKAQGAEVWIHAMPRSAWLSFAEHHVIDLEEETLAISESNGANDVEHTSLSSWCLYFNMHGN